MPLIVSSRLPAYQVLEKEFVPIIRKHRAEHQDIRPLNIGLLNLMPSEVYQQTEIQFFRFLGNTPLQINPILVRFDTIHSQKEAGIKHLENFYHPFSEVKKIGLDGLIITGANIEHLPYEEITFWEELTEVFQWTENFVASTIFSCWASHAALDFFFGIKKERKEKKIFGVYPHRVRVQNDLTRNMDDRFDMPHSRWGNISPESIIAHPELEILVESINPKVGFGIASTKNHRKIFIQGHPEYDRFDLKKEYLRDKEQGQSIPENYFPEDNPKRTPEKSWSANGQVFYNNWINWVYQHTHYDLQKCLMEEP